MRDAELVEAEDYEIDKVKDFIYAEEDVVKYLVKWEGWPARKYWTWEPFEHFYHPELLLAFYCNSLISLKILGFLRILLSCGLRRAFGRGDLMLHVTGYPTRSRDRSCDRHTVTATRSPPHGHRYTVTATQSLPHGHRHTVTATQLFPHGHSHPWPGYVPGYVPGHVPSHVPSYVMSYVPGYVLVPLTMGIY